MEKGKPGQLTTKAETNSKDHLVSRKRTITKTPAGTGSTAHGSSHVRRRKDSPTRSRDEAQDHHKNAGVRKKKGRLVRGRKAKWALGREESLFAHAMINQLRKGIFRKMGDHPDRWRRKGKK